jgi:ankyrin repeat protein
LKGHALVVEILLNSGADIWAISKRGWSPLKIAVLNGHAKVIAIPLNKGADVDVGAKGVTALQWALYGGHVGSVERLLQANATLSSTRVDGKTPLVHEAAKSGEARILELLLLSAGVNATTMDSCGHIALFRAGECSKLQAVIGWILAWSNVSMEDVKWAAGQSPETFEILYRNGYLRRTGIELDRFIRGALDLARKNNWEEFIESLTDDLDALPPLTSNEAVMLSGNNE